jgi:hypothetical protein
MKADLMLDRFILVFVAVVLTTTGYMAWVIHTTGYHWFHLYWMGLGIWGFYVLVHIERVFGACRDREFKALVDDWVRRGEPDEPLDLKR